jgi:5-methylcytosine-specific restriction enzyme B
MNSADLLTISGVNMSVEVQSLEDVVLPGKSDRFGELLRSIHFDQVVAANRLYLSAAVSDALATEKHHWALSCLPTTGQGSRFSTLSMGGQEMFAVFKPMGNGISTAHVFVAESVLASFGIDLGERDLEVSASPYVAGGDDQIEVFGRWEDLAPALADRPLRTAARAFAERLLPQPCAFARYHDDELAGRVLGRS